MWKWAWGSCAAQKMASFCKCRMMHETWATRNGQTDPNLELRGFLEACGQWIDLAIWLTACNNMQKSYSEGGQKKQQTQYRVKSHDQTTYLRMTEYVWALHRSQLLAIMTLMTMLSMLWRKCFNIDFWSNHRYIEADPEWACPNNLSYL